MTSSLSWGCEVSSLPALCPDCWDATSVTAPHTSRTARQWASTLQGLSTLSSFMVTVQMTFQDYMQQKRSRLVYGLYITNHGHINKKEQNLFAYGHLQGIVPRPDTGTHTTKAWLTLAQIIIAFKAVNRNCSQSVHCAANRLQHVRPIGPGALVCKSRAIHRALITCNMSCYVPLGTKGQLSY